MLTIGLSRAEPSAPKANDVADTDTAGDARATSDVAY
jgi:hypothetical protein